MWTFEIRNIGGIQAGDATLQQGINSVQADNWQGKSSFITAIRTTMGTTGMNGTDHPLTEGTEEGVVTFETDDQKYKTLLGRDGGSITRSGDTYLTEKKDRISAHLFAFLGEDNPVRAAVRTGDDLAELLTRPLDLENVDEQITSLQRERDRVETELQQAEQAANKLPSVQEEITQLENELADLRDEIEGVQTNAEEEDEQRALRDKLSSKRAKRSQLTSDITRIENTIDRTESRLDEKEQELEELVIPDDVQMDADLKKKRSRISELDTQIEMIEDLHSANKRVLDDELLHFVTDVDRSIAGDDVACWTCGTTTAVGDFQTKVNDLEETIKELRSKRSDLQSTIDNIQRRQREREQKQRKRKRLETEIDELETDLEESRHDIEDRRERLDEIEKEIEELDEAVEETDEQLTDLQSDIKLKEQALTRKESTYSDLESQKSAHKELQDRHDELNDEISELRDRKKRKQREIADQFEGAMAEIIDRFDPGFESARLEPKTNAADEIVDFDLIVARDGRETNLDALSEGEVELIGIVTALAGYKTYNVHERVPAILLDDVGSLSGSRIQTLVNYLDEEAKYVVTTAYPETGNFGHTVSPSEWDIVSNEQITTT